MVPVLDVMAIHAPRRPGLPPHHQAMVPPPGTEKLRAMSSSEIQHGAPTPWSGSRIGARRKGPGWVARLYALSHQIDTRSRFPTRHRFRWQIPFVAGCLFAASPLPAEAQVEATIIPARVTCPACRIELSAALVLGDTAGPGELPQSAYFVRRDERGRSFLSFFSRRPMVFDHAGRFLYFVGGMGDGPGEFRTPLLFEARRDSLWVADPTHARISVFHDAGTEARFQTSWSHPGIVSPPAVLVRGRTGALYMHTMIPSRERIGYPLHLLHLDGRMHSFGADHPVFDPRAPRLISRVAATGEDGGLWVLHATRYLVEHYDSTGALVARWQRVVPWFPPNRGDQVMDETRPPQPRATAIAIDGQGLVWMLFLVPDPKHRQAFGPTPPSAPGSRVRLVDLKDEDLYFDTVVEVFDPGTGGIVASSRMEPSLVALLGDSRGGAWSVAQRESGHGGYQVLLRHLRLSPARP